MENIEISKIIDGVEVRAITTYVQRDEFGIKLQDSELLCSFSSPHCFAKALSHPSCTNSDGTSTEYGLSVFTALELNPPYFFNSDGTITENGLNQAYTFIDALWAASQKIIQFKEKIDYSLNLSAERIIHITNIVDKIIERFYEFRRSLKSSFKNNGMDQRTYMSLLKMVNKKINQTIYDLDYSSSKIIWEYTENIEGLFIETERFAYSVNDAISYHCRAITNKKIEEIKSKKKPL
jgi:hypothetical protein